MILVDQLRECGAPWPGGVACHLGTNDGNLETLHAFARGLGIPRRWFQPSNHPLRAHYDLAPRYRAAAVKAGAVEIGAIAWARERVAKIRAERVAPTPPEGA